MIRGSTIHRDCRLVARSRNLRGILDYARRSPVERVDCQRLVGEFVGYGTLYSVTLIYDDGAIGECDFADWRVLCDFIRNRRSWGVQRFTGLPEFVAAMEG